MNVRNSRTPIPHRADVFGHVATLARVAKRIVHDVEAAMRAVPEDGRRYPVRIRRMVVFPGTVRAKQPMTSPASTSSETWSTANLGPYHLVRCSATMTGGMPGGGAAPRTDLPSGGRGLPLNPDCVTYFEHLRSVRARAYPPGRPGRGRS